MKARLRYIAPVLGSILGVLVGWQVVVGDGVPRFVAAGTIAVCVALVAVYAAFIFGPRFTIQRRSAAFVLLAVIGLALIRWTESDARYTLGHPDGFDVAIVSMLTLLGLTHVFLAAIMWVQRGRWLPSEASMFRWVSMKGLFWFNLSLAYVPRGLGVRLDIAFLYVLIAATTIDMDVKMFYRYILGREPRDGEVRR